MNSANVEAFLELLFMDCEDAGTPVEGRPGIVRYPVRSFEDEDLHLTTYESEEEHLLALDSDSHTPAYEAAMLAMLSLRRYWRETSEYYAEKTPAEVMEALSDDVVQVLNLLGRVKANLSELATTEHTLGVRAEAAEADMKKAESALRKVEKEVKGHNLRLAMAKRRIKMMKVLTEAPIEQVARLGKDNDQQPTPTGAETK